MSHPTSFSFVLLMFIFQLGPAPAVIRNADIKFFHCIGCFVLCFSKNIDLTKLNSQKTQLYPDTNFSWFSMCFCRSVLLRQWTPQTVQFVIMLCNMSSYLCLWVVIWSITLTSSHNNSSYCWSKYGFVHRGKIVVHLPN